MDEGIKSTDHAIGVVEMVLDKRLPNHVKVNSTKYVFGNEEKLMHSNCHYGSYSAWLKLRHINTKGFDWLIVF